MLIAPLKSRKHVHMFIFGKKKLTRNFIVKMVTPQEKNTMAFREKCRT